MWSATSAGVILPCLLQYRHSGSFWSCAALFARHRRSAYQLAYWLLATQPHIRQALPRTRFLAFLVGGVAVQVGVGQPLQRVSDSVHRCYRLILCAAHGDSLRSECSMTWTV